MSARFLVRFDDICHTMNWMVWDKIEVILKGYGITPILAVVPANRDPHLVVGAPYQGFWDRVRQWQSWGWTIALHGYQHVYETREAGIVGMNTRSEFAGVCPERQVARILAALEVFQCEGIEPTVWVSPAHSFDEITVEILQRYGIKLISDGFFLRPIRYLNSVWIPQQMWRFRPFPFGLWTVCYHHNRFSEEDLCRFEKDIQRYQPKIISLKQLLTCCPIREIGAFDRFIATTWLQAVRLKRWIGR